MKKYEVDVAVIGGGSAGLASAIIVKKAGLDVIIKSLSFRKYSCS